MRVAKEVILLATLCVPVILSHASEWPSGNMLRLSNPSIHFARGEMGNCSTPAFFFAVPCFDALQIKAVRITGK